MALTDGLIAYYKLDGNSTDSIGSFNGTDVAISYVSGFLGQAGSFNGSTSYIKMGNVMDETGSNPFTLRMMIKYTSTGNDMFITKQMSSGNFNGYALWRNSAQGKIDFSIVSTGTNILELVFPDDYNDGAWHEIVITYDGSKTPGGCVGYVGGSVVTLTTLLNSLTGSSTTTAEFNIGARNNGNLPTNGLIDEVGKWNRVLSASEVAELLGKTYNFTSTFIPRVTIF